MSDKETNWKNVDLMFGHLEHTYENETDFSNGKIWVHQADWCMDKARKEQLKEVVGIIDSYIKNIRDAKKFTNNDAAHDMSEEKCGILAGLKIDINNKIDEMEIDKE